MAHNNTQHKTHRHKTTLKTTYTHSPTPTQKNTKHTHNTTHTHTHTQHIDTHTHTHTHHKTHIRHIHKELSVTRIRDMQGVAECTCVHEEAFGWGNRFKHGSSRGQLKCDGTRAETRFRLSAKRTSPFKSAGSSVQSTSGQPRCVHQR